MSDRSEKLAMKWLKAAPVKWERGVNASFGSPEIYIKQEVIRDLNAISQRAAMLSEYIQSRIGMAGSPVRHEKAVARANKRLVAVRKALGYAFPKSGRFTF